MCQILKSSQSKQSPKPNAACSVHHPSARGTDLYGSRGRDDEVVVDRRSEVRPQHLLELGVFSLRECMFRKEVNVDLDSATSNKQPKRVDRRVRTSRNSMCLTLDDTPICSKSKAYKQQLITCRALTLVMRRLRSASTALYRSNPCASCFHTFTMAINKTEIMDQTRVTA